MSLIESYDFTEGGFHPVLVRDSWQVAKINYKEEYHINHLKKLVKHQKSDRGIALLSGYAVLIASEDGDYQSEFDIVLMKRGTSYNIPKNIGYAIVMVEGCELFIVEKPNTNYDDVNDCHLDDAQLNSIRNRVMAELKKVR